MAKQTELLMEGALWVVGEAFMALKRRGRQLFHEIECDMTAEQAIILVILSQKGSLHLKDIAELSERDRTTTTRMVDGLKRRKWVARVQDTRDKRQKLISLTKEGRKRLAGTELVDTRLQKIALAGISAGRVRMTCEVLRKICDNLDSGKDLRVS